MPKLQVELPKPMSRQLKSWRKVLVNIDPMRPGGYAFEGDWLAGEIVDVEPGALVMLYDEHGSRKQPDIRVRLWALRKDGQWLPLYDHEVTERPWARAVMQEVTAVADAHKARQVGDEPDNLEYLFEVLQKLGDVEAGLGEHELTAADPEERAAWRALRARVQLALQEGRARTLPTIQATGG